MSTARGNLAYEDSDIAIHFQKLNRTNYEDGMVVVSSKIIPALECRKIWQEGLSDKQVKDTGAWVADTVRMIKETNAKIIDSVGRDNMEHWQTVKALKEL